MENQILWFGRIKYDSHFLLNILIHIYSNHVLIYAQYSIDHWKHAGALNQHIITYFQQHHLKRNTWGEKLRP